jgi:TQXA domain-containing protein
MKFIRKGLSMLAAILMAAALIIPAASTSVYAEQYTYSITQSGNYWYVNNSSNDFVYSINENSHTAGDGFVELLNMSQDNVKFLALDDSHEYSDGARIISILFYGYPNLMENNLVMTTSYWAEFYYQKTGNDLLSLSDDELHQATQDAIWHVASGKTLTENSPADCLVQAVENMDSGQENTTFGVFTAVNGKSYRAAAYAQKGDTSGNVFIRMYKEDYIRDYIPNKAMWIEVNSYWNTNTAPAYPNVQFDLVETAQDGTEVVLDSRVISGGTAKWKFWFTRKAGHSYTIRETLLNVPSNGFTYQTAETMPASWFNADGAAMIPLVGDGVINGRKVECENKVLSPSSVYTLTYNANGGTGSMEPVTAAAGSVQTVASSSFAKQNSTFVEWNTAADGSGTSYQPGSSLTLNSDITLYAIWQENAPVSYTVSFDANGGTGSMEPVTVMDGYCTLPANGFTAPDGKEFSGWSLSRDGNILTSSQLEVTQDTTLYAVWRSTEQPKPSISPEPTVSPTPSVSPEPTVSPTPTVSPEPTVNPTPSVSTEQTVSSTPTVSPAPKNSLPKTGVSGVKGWAVLLITALVAGIYLKKRQGK